MLNESRLLSFKYLNTATIFLAIICLIFLGFDAYVNSFGDYPLDDDWSFAETVKSLAKTGSYQPVGWASMPFITNALWGALFCVFSTCSFQVLRLSTLVLSLLGLWGCYVLVKDLGQPRWLAIVVALTWGFNPICFALSYSFMTDVPFAAISIMAAVFLIGLGRAAAVRIASSISNAAR